MALILCLETLYIRALADFFYKILCQYYKNLNKKIKNLKYEPFIPF